MSIIDKVIGNPDSPSTQPAADSPPAKKVLIVEDDQYLREFYSDLLKNAGINVITAENGQSGLTMIMTEKPNAVILDIMMPVMDGKSMLHRVRAMEEFKYLPVIILTNAGDADNMRDTIRYENANAFLIKSNITPEELLSTVKGFL